MSDATATDVVEVKVPDIGDFDDVPVIEVHVAPGDTIAGPHSLAFEVLDADPRRLKRVRIRYGSSTPSDGPSESLREPALPSATLDARPRSSAA